MDLRMQLAVLITEIRHGVGPLVCWCPEAGLASRYMLHAATAGTLNMTILAIPPAPDSLSQQVGLYCGRCENTAR